MLPTDTALDSCTDELRKIASDEKCAPTTPPLWSEKFKETPLYQKALDFEKIERRQNAQEALRDVKREHERASESLERAQVRYQRVSMESALADWRDKNPKAAEAQKTASVLTANARKHIKGKNFALPGGRYPIEDKAHAQNALARVSQFGSSAEKAKVRAKVHSKYPTMG